MSSLRKLTVEPQQLLLHSQLHSAGVCLVLHFICDQHIYHHNLVIINYC